MRSGQASKANIGQQLVSEGHLARAVELACYHHDGLPQEGPLVPKLLRCQLWGDHDEREQALHRLAVLGEQRLGLGALWPQRGV